MHTSYVRSTCKTPSGSERYRCPGVPCQAHLSAAGDTRDVRLADSMFERVLRPRRGRRPGKEQNKNDCENGQKSARARV